MSWTILEQIETVLLADQTLSPGLRTLLRTAADYIRDLEDTLESAESGPDDIDDAFAELARDIRDVLLSHGV